MKDKAIFCPLQGVIDIIGKKWALLVINEVGNHGRIRFNELKKELRFITSKTLTKTLKELEENRLVIRTVFNEIPPRVEYSLTDDGRELHKSIIGLLNWAANREGAVVKRCSCIKS